MPRRAQDYKSPNKLVQHSLTDLLQHSQRLAPSKYARAPSSKRKHWPIPNTEEPSESSDKAASDNDEDLPPRPPKRKRRSRVVDHPEYKLSDDDENIGVPVRWTGKGKRKVVEDSEDELQPLRGRLSKGTRPPSSDEDSDDLDETQILDNRFRSRRQKTKYQMALERINNSRKSGKVGSRSPSCGEISEESVSEESVVTSFKGARPNASGASNQSQHGDTQLLGSQDSEDEGDENEDDGFIVQDPNDAPQVDLPIAFSMNAHQDLAHQFKIISQFFVHIAVHPLPERRAYMQDALKAIDYFSAPLLATRRKLASMRDSLVSSSVWTSEFKKKLEKFPEFTLVRMDYTEPGCDACRLSGRISTLLGRLSGIPYDHYGFEDLADIEPDGSTSDEDTDNQSVFMGKGFLLGRFCARRTRIYHEFSHWEYQLYKRLEMEITTLQNPSGRFVKVAYAGGTLPCTDLENPDKIMDWLDERHIIEMEWQNLRRMMNSAINLEAAAKKGDDDEDC